MIDLTVGRKTEFKADGPVTWVVYIEDAQISGGGERLVLRQQAVGNWNDGFSVIVDNRLRVGSLSPISFTVDPNLDGGIAAASTFTFAIDCTDDYIDTLLSLWRFDGSPITARVHAPCDTSSTIWTDSVKVFSGQVTDTRFKNDALEVVCEGRDFLYHKQCPPDVYSPADEYDEFGVSTGLAGKVIPIVFGKHDACETVRLAEIWDNGSADRGTAFKVGGAVGLYELSEISKVKYGTTDLVQASGGFAEILDSENPYTADVANGLFYFHDLPEDGQVVGIEFEIWPNRASLRGSYDSSITDRQAALDGRDGTFANVPLISAPGVPTVARGVSLRLPAIGVSGTIYGDSTTPSIWLLWKVESGPDFESATGPPARGSGFGATICTIEGRHIYMGNYSVNLPMGWGLFDAAANDADIDNTDPDSPNRYSYRLAYSSATWTDYEEVSALADCWLMFCVAAHGDTGAATDSDWMKVYKLGLVIRCELDMPSSGFFAEAEGFLDISATYTGVTDQLIENPSDLTLFMWAELGGLPAAGYSTADFTRARSSRSAWVFARQLMERDGTDKFIEEICEQAFLWTWVDRAGDARIFSMGAAELSEATYTLSESDVIPNTVKAYRVENSEISTGFNVRYRTNPVSSDSDAILFCNATDSSDGLGTVYEDLCDDAKDDFCGGEERDADDIELDWIRDDDTALLYTKALITRRTKRPWIIEWEADISMLFLELGDPVDIESTDFTGVIPALAKAEDYRITGVELDPENQTIHFTAAQVYDI